jgi:hypothetical protein
MTCHVGITTEPQERRQYWQTQHPFLRNWRIVGRYSTKTDARVRENAEAIRHGCQAHLGGDGDEYATWYVYYFEY